MPPQNDAAAGGSAGQDDTTSGPRDTSAGAAADLGSTSDADDTAGAVTDGGLAVPDSGDASTPASSTGAEAGTSQSETVDAGSQDTQILPTPDTPPAGCNTELLANGGFEGGEAVWVTASSWPGAHAIVGAQDLGLQKEGVAPQNGSYLGWLGGIPDNEFDDHEVSIEQPFNVPADTSRLEFKGYVRVATLEPPDGVGYDFVYVDVLSSSETVNWVPHIWSNVDASSDWVAFSDEVTDERLDALRGKTVLLRLHSETDPEKKTSFWFDTLSVTAECGR